MFFRSGTDHAPWTVLKSNDKKCARLQAMRHVLNLFDYNGKDRGLVGNPDPKILGRASRVISHHQKF